VQHTEDDDSRRSTKKAVLSKTYHHHHYLLLVVSPPSAEEIINSARQRLLLHNNATIMTIMTSFIRLLLAALIATVSAQLELSCEAPSNGCTYGLWNFDKCLCECIQPFCPDANGDCVLPLDNCGGNPWRDCTRGVDCPWWNSLSTAETCNTGNTVSCVKCCHGHISYVVVGLV